MPQKIKVSDDRTKNWNNDHLQFARLLAEIQACTKFKITTELMESMDLSKEQIIEVLDRAEAAWEDVKYQT